MKEIITIPEGVTFKSLNPVLKDNCVTFNDKLMELIINASGFISDDREILEVTICFTFYLHWKIETNNKIVNRTDKFGDGFI